MELDPSAKAPKCCPTCQSVHLTTTSKVINTATYWRCERCGDVWNAGRRDKATDRYPRPWRTSR